MRHKSRITDHESLPPCHAARWWLWLVDVTRQHPERFSISEQVSQALAARKPVVALESTVIAHGLPEPLNVETARTCEETIRQRGAEPATIGIVGGTPVVGLNDDELNVFGRRDGDHSVAKVGLNNLAAVMQKREWGATTVGASLRIAHAAGIRVFSTGGIGGVHRGAEQTFDISADLTALAGIPMVCVCAGAKSILDLPKTVELLETCGVPVVGYRTAEFPAFYSSRSNLPVDATVETPEEAAQLALNHWISGGAGAVLLCVPIPEPFEIPAAEVEEAIELAIKKAEAQGVSGKRVTPFLLSQLENITSGRTLAANRALLINNADVAALVAVSLLRSAAI